MKGESLEDKSGCCSCKDLSKLFELRANASSLENRCNNLNKKVYASSFLNSQSSGKYLKSTEQYINAVDEYNQKIMNLIDNGKLRLIFHDYNSPQQKREVSYSEIQTLKEKGEISIHCANCEQQIDVVA